jgi:hypothetical protein
VGKLPKNMKNTSQSTVTRWGPKKTNQYRHERERERKKTSAINKNKNTCDAVSHKSKSSLEPVIVSGRLLLNSDFFFVLSLDAAFLGSLCGLPKLKSN